MRKRSSSVSNYEMQRFVGLHGTICQNRYFDFV
jgi:hypothetical protein